MIVERKRGLGLHGIMPTIWKGRKERSWGKGRILHLQVLTVWWRERKTKQSLRRQRQVRVPFH